MLTETELLSWLRAGDVLCYKGLAFVRWKTWSDTGHTEMYLGQGLSAAARAGGVDTYPFEPKDLVLVVRPNQPFDMAKMRAFHATCAGKQRYDWWGLVRVFLLNKKGAQDRAFCSEHVARMARAENGGPEMFNSRADCDEISPGQIPLSPHYNWWTPEEIADDIGRKREARYVAKGRPVAGPPRDPLGPPLGAA